MNLKTKRFVVSDKSGFTLMEILLVTALLGILTAASFSIIYWQMRIQSHVTQNAVIMNRLVNTQMMMRKVLRSIAPASLTVDTNAITYHRGVADDVDLFSFSSNTLKYDGDAVLEGVIASFSKRVASGAIDIDTGVLSDTNLIWVEFSTTGRETRNIRFVVRPRGQSS